MLRLVILLSACSDEAFDKAADPSGDTAADSAVADDSGHDSAATAECTDPLPVESDFVPQGSTWTGTLADCGAVRLVGAGAVNSTLEIDVQGDVTVELSDIAGHDLGPSPAQLFQSGEFFIDVLPRHEGTAAASVTITCVDGCDLAYTRYPILLLHGFAAAGMFAGTDYFYQLRDTLEAEGYLVRNPSVSPFTTSEARGVEWGAWIDGYMAEGIGRKFNLIAHSQGGLDARYMIGALHYGDRVASLDMVGTPNQGTIIADILGGTISDGYVDPAIVDAGAAIFATLYGMNGTGSLADAIGALTTASVATLNAESPDDPNVYYSSWAGVSCLNLDSSCRSAHADETIEPIMEPLFLIAYAYGLDNDGLVPADSVPWGEYMGELSADHADEIGAFADEDNPSFNHLEFYQSEVERLAGMGF